MVLQKPIVVDCRGHLLGRLASIIAKELLLGQQVVAVRCEEIDISGSLMRNKMKFQRFLRKRTNTNPKRGPIHYRSPSRILWRTIRGMIPHKKARGAAALQRLKVFEGIPAPFDKMKRMVIPAALRVTRLAPGRRYTNLGRLSSEFGWGHGDLVKRLEAKRKVKSEAFYQKKKEAAKLKAKATQEADLSAVTPVLEQYGL